jgi:hypothetical protein
MSFEFEIVDLIQNVGVPLGFALLFYLDFRKLIQKNTESINELRTVVILLTESKK